MDHLDFEKHKGDCPELFPFDDEINHFDNLHANYLYLWQVTKFLQEENIFQREKKVAEFLSQMYQNKIAEYKPSEIGFF